MRICQILASSGIGGLENHFISLSNKMSIDHDVVVIADESFREQLSDSVKLIPFNFSGSRWNPFRLRKLKKIFQSLEVDVIHCHANKTAQICKTLKSSMKAPCIGTIHGVKKDLSMFRALDGVIGVSQGVLQELNHPQQTVIYNGVEPFTATPYDQARLRELFSIKNDDPIYIAVGRYAPVKAYDALIESFVGLEANLLLVGDGPEREKLERLISQNNLKSRVTLTGFRNDVQSLLGGVDGMLMPSHREGFSYAFVEALLQEVPVIATKVPGCVDLLPKKYLLETNEVAKMHLDLKELMVKQSDFDADFEDLFTWAKENLFADAMVRNTLEYYEKIYSMK